MSTAGSTEPASAPVVAERHPRALEPATLVITALLAILGGVIGLHLVTTLGISPNTSVIGALVAMLVGRIGFAGLSRFRDTHRQNLAQTSISAATFAAANSLLTPIAVPFAFGRTDLVWPMLLGAAIGLIIDGWILYRAFGSSFLPADAAWPPGVAAAETIKAGDRGGRQALILIIGTVVGVGGSLAGMSMSAAGVAFIGNIAALALFGVGLLINQYAPGLLHLDLTELYIPHGVMIGAGLVALIQAAMAIFRRSVAAPAGNTLSDAGPGPSLQPTVDAKQLRRTFGTGYLLYLGGALVLATTTALWSHLSVPAIIGWALFAAFAAIVHELIVGLAAMHAGWFPAFAVTLIFLVVGLLVGMPAVPLVLLVGYCAATGPAFADMGYDLKAGWILRRTSRPYLAYEIDGRRQQLISAMIGFGVAIGMVLVLWRGYFHSGQLPPVSQVYADTIRSGLGRPDVLRNLLLAAVPGAVIQLVGGPKRQLGILLATGLLISTPNAGWMVLAALVIRLVWGRIRGADGEKEISVFGAGLIAGDSLFSIGRIFGGK
ncbi:OPT/YSL family transporter [Microlunatus endophyticus]|uniref:OPT/YSL family transporter n=1 Tax=Microlunatus endophyticus TaxID=1716077 RepID=UPI00166E7454|nr:OPT/YSL family transporter [Microlunatus endophyticus]